jgi:hypothetical protein
MTEQGHAPGGYRKQKMDVAIGRMVNDLVPDRATSPDSMVAYSRDCLCALELWMCVARGHNCLRNGAIEACATPTPKSDLDFGTGIAGFVSSFPRVNLPNAYTTRTTGHATIKTLRLHWHPIQVWSS